MINRDTISMIVRKMSREEMEHREKKAHGAGANDEKKNIVDALVAGHACTTGEVKELLCDLKEQNKTIVLWGASHQGFTLAATTPIRDQAAYIIDSAPFKQGRFAPSSHLPIVPPEHFFDHPVDVIMIVAPGYSDEIAGVIRTRFGSDVKILTLRTEHIETL